MKKKSTPQKKIKTHHKSFPIVAIGASAGGLEAVTELLKNLSPNTGMAYVYIQHLDPTHKSMLGSILSKTTKMKVEEVKNLTHVAPDNLYIIPPDKDMLLTDGVLKLQPRSNGKKPHLPIDRFFISLAEKRKENAIGIVLSGNASDGTIGSKAIKVAGGLTFAQDESAKFPSMPKSAVSEGVVDLVLSPKEMAKELERLGTQPHVLQSGAEISDSVSDGELANILQLLNRSTGVDFSHYKKNTIKRRVIRRMVLFKQPNLKEYAKYLRQHTNEINLLYQDLLINVTSFFRDANTMAFLKKTLLPKILKTKTSTNPIRVWVPACSTGEEAYSLAMVLMELLGDKVNNTSMQIFATDLSENAINKARQGIYNKNELLNISPKRLERFFTTTDNNYRVIKSIRDLCVFASHNIFRDPPFSRLDLISCCNLLIYLDPVLQKKVIGTFHYALNPTGYLILGKSETVGPSPNLFSLVDKKLKIYTQKKEAVSRALLDMTYRVPGIEKLRSPLIKTVIHKEPVKNNDLEKRIDAILLERYTPASVLVNENLDILHFRGSTGLFIEPTPGKASLNLLKMANQALGFELRNAIHKVSKSGKSFKKTGLEVKHKNSTYTVNIEVIPIKSAADEKNFLVIFEEVGLSLHRSFKNTLGERKIKLLEQELLASREDMRSIVEEQEAVNEELQSANEEIVSSNEELQSINEELETSKEEVESANEELLTINQEMQVRNEQLTESYEYSEAVIANIRECALILDLNLRVKSANRAFYKKFKVEEEDTEGQRVYELVNGQFDIPKLHELLDEMLPANPMINGFKIINTFHGIGEKVMLVNARRVVQKSHEQQIILLAIEDITEQISAARLIAEREGWVKNMAENMPAMVWVGDVNKNRIYFNSAWLKFTGKKSEEEEGAKWMTGIHKDDYAAFLKAYTVSYEMREPFRIEYRLRRYDGEYRWILSIGNPTYNQGGIFTGYIGTSTEIHDHRMMNVELEKRVDERTHALKRANFDLERSNSELEQFAYVASHDLQEPLRKIMMFCDKLENYHKNELPSEISSYLKKIDSNAGRMSQLISELLSFSRVTKSDDKFIETDLNRIVQEVLKDFDLIIKENKAKINVGPLPVIEAVPVEMTQLFHNLISNALKFSHSDRTSKISITNHILTAEEIASYPSFRKEDRYIAIEIKDNGIGFPSEFANQVFVIFQRLNDDKIKYPGTGIGLALCKKIVNYHNGIIYAEPKEYKGAVFHIILPIRHSK